MKRVFYRRPDSGNPVLAFVLCATGEATLLFVPSFEGEKSDSLVMSARMETEGNRCRSIHAWRGSGVRFPHFSCNRFLARPLLPAQDFPRFPHVVTNTHLRWRGPSPLAAVSHFPPYGPLWQGKREMLHPRKIWPDHVSEPSHASENLLQALPAGAGKKRQIQFPPTPVEQIRKGINYREQTAIKYRAHAQN